ncbi:hypothetical protein PG984_005148 [Apiospora sp. TS-2023a]
MSEPNPSTALRKMRPGDWDNYRDLISRWYITENKTVPGIIKDLKESEHGFIVAQYELKDRIATWGLRKNLARREQECLVAQRKRKLREGEGSTQEYAFAGQCLSEERMKRLEYRLDHPIMAWGRHTRGKHNQPAEFIYMSPARLTFLIRLGLGPLVSDPSTSSDVLDQSPMPPSVDLVVLQPSLHTLQSNQIYEWKPWKETPHTLPWIKFSRNTALFNAISHALFGGSSRRFVASSDSKYILQSSSGQLGFGSSSIDQLYKSFSRLMPESREGENMDRARSLVKTRGELDMEMLKVVLFQLANNFIGQDDYEHIVRLTERFGLGKPPIIRALFGVATKDLTIAAMLDKLFIAACQTPSLELVKVLVQENKEVKNGQLVRVLDFDMMPALTISVNQTDIGVLKAIMDVSSQSIIDHPWERVRKINDRKIWTELLYCKDPQFTNSLLEMLVPKIKYIQAFLDCLLFRALNAGNTSLALKSIGYGADTCARTASPEFYVLQDSSWNKRPGKTIKFRRHIQILDYHTLYTACIVPLDFAIEPFTASIPQAHEEIAMRTYEQMATSLGREDFVPIDVLISAAYLGYTSTLKELANGPRDLNRSNGRGMSPLIASVLGGSVDACSCLLELGADPNFTYSNPPSSISGLSQIDPALGRFPTALHHAIFLGHRQIVDILIKFKADINQLCDHTTMHQSWDLGGCWWCCSHSYQPHVPGLICSMEKRTINALNIATKRGCTGQFNGWVVDENVPEFDYLEVSRLLLKHGAHAGYLELHLAIEFGCKYLVEDILSKSDNMGHLDTSLKNMTPFQVALSTRNTPICETLLSAGFRVDATLEDLYVAVEGGSAKVLDCVLRALKATCSPCTPELAKALQIALELGFSDVVDILIDEGVQLPPNWWSYAFATYQADTLLNILERMEVTQDMMTQRPQEGYSGLEAAMLSPYMGVADIALDRFPRAYDSGALLARLCQVLSADSSPDAQLDELLKRRQTVHEKDFTPALENAAIALAAYFQKSDLLNALLEKPQPQALALIPGPGLFHGIDDWEDEYDTNDEHVSWLDELLCIRPGCSCMIACKNLSLSRECLGYRRWWHSRHSLRETSPIFMAAKGYNTDAIDQLILKGYESDLWTILAAVHWQRPTLIIQKLLKTWRNHKLELRIWESCPRSVKFLIDEGCLDIIKLLTDPGAKTGNLYYKTNPSSSYTRKWFDGPKTALQLAIHANRASDDLVSYLVEKGADVTAPAHPDSGLSALQLAAMQGKITLARYLIKEGAQINEPRAHRSGRTSLEAAAEAGRLDMVQFLLNEGAETTGKGRVQYLRAIKLARAEGHAAVEKLLRRHRLRDMLDDIIDAQDIIIWGCRPTTEDIETFLHPDEATFEERHNVRRWCIANGLEPPHDAELGLLSREELDLPCRERMEILATIMGNDREIKRRMKSSLGKKLDESYLPPPLGRGMEWVVATEVEILRRNIPPTTSSTEYSNASDERTIDEALALRSVDDMGDVSSHQEVLQETTDFPVQEVAGADENIGPKIRFHPEFNRRRDSVDFHETMHDEFLV